MSKLRSVAALVILLGIAGYQLVNLWPHIRPQNVSASESWVITSFHSDVTIASSSALTVVEDISVDFGSLKKHGIFRTIPLRYRYDDSHDRYYKLEVVSVTDGARLIAHSDSIDSDNYVIKIGNPSLLVSGMNRYVITYTVAV